MKILKKLKLNDNTNKLNKVDWIIMGVMVLIYGLLSFYRLGDTKVPVTYHTFIDAGDSVIVTLKEESNVSMLRYYTGNDLGEITVLASNDGKDYSEVTNITISSVFSWQDTYFNIRAKYLKFVAVQPGSTLGDIGLYFSNEEVPIIDSTSKVLIDEIDLIPDEISYMNSTYFDEIYYGRSAYEYVHGLNVYEWSHPQLGKLLMSIPVLLFGFSPFTYRLMGNIVGILLIPLMYILAKKFFKNRKWALLAALIMMFDNFHFAHTRIALVDGFQVFFILLSVLFMKNYIDLEKDAPFKKQALYLILSGTFIGCAITTKWNAVYAGLGLAIVFFVHLFKMYNVNVIKYCKKNINLKHIIKIVTFFLVIPFVLYYLVLIIINKGFATTLITVYYVVLALFLLTIFYNFLLKDKYLIKLMLICILSFIIIPLIIYILSYLLFPNVSYYDGTLGGIIDLNKMMYDYHSGLDATHPFSSSWYQWPIMYKPVWLYSGATSDGLIMTITDIGNPVIWWTGIVAVLYLIINAFRKKNKEKDKYKNSVFILIFILSTFIPYVFIGRLMFMYHYFITLPFVMLAIVFLIKWITEKLKNDRVYYGYIALIIITFILFYPVVSGMPIESEYIESLKWFSTWYF